MIRVAYDFLRDGRALFAQTSGPISDQKHPGVDWATELAGIAVQGTEVVLLEALDRKELRQALLHCHRLGLGVVICSKLDEVAGGDYLFVTRPFTARQLAAAVWRASERRGRPVTNPTIRSSTASA